MITYSKARFKRRILHAPNRIAKLNACKMRRLNQLNAVYFNSLRVSRIEVNIVIIEHLYKIGIKTSFTITMKINVHH